MLHYSILMCLALMLLLSPQRCLAPTCHTGSLERESCKCIITRPSICPPWFTRVGSHGNCICQRTTRPRCPSGTILTDNCKCIVKQSPSCPLGTEISPPSAFCHGTAQPVCPCEALLNPDECSCEEIAKPVCPQGNTLLSSNGCTCSVLPQQHPQCSRDCYLHMDGCLCSPKATPITVTAVG